jgi:hypothetical protein
MEWWEWVDSLLNWFPLGIFGCEHKWTYGRSEHSKRRNVRKCIWCGVTEQLNSKYEWEKV